MNDVAALRTRIAALVVAALLAISGATVIADAGFAVEADEPGKAKAKAKGTDEEG